LTSKIQTAGVYRLLNNTLYTATFGFTD